MRRLSFDRDDASQLAAASRSHLGYDRKTHCPYSPFQCGMTVTAHNTPRDTFDVKADPEFPVNRGQMCIKGFTSATLLDHPARLRSPLLRNVSGRLVPVSWDSALDFIAQKLTALSAQHGPAARPRSAAAHSRTRRLTCSASSPAWCCGTPNIDYNGRYCMASAAAGQNRAFGLDRGLPFPVADIAETEALMLWGSNCADDDAADHAVGVRAEAAGRQARRGRSAPDRNRTRR